MGTTYSSNRDIVKFQAEGMRIYGIVLMSPLCLIARNCLVDGQGFNIHGILISAALFLVGFYFLAYSYKIIYRMEENKND